MIFKIMHIEIHGACTVVASLAVVAQLADTKGQKTPQRVDREELKMKILCKTLMKALCQNLKVT